MTILAISLISTFIFSCGWKPEVSAVPITAPWAQMNLPVKENAIVWESGDKIFKAVHKDDKKTILKNYVEALKTQGWQLGNFDDHNPDTFSVDMTKGAEAINLYIYDFHNTGVIIEKK